MTGRSLEFVIPGDLSSATGGYGYDRRMIAELRGLGHRVTVHPLDSSFPCPSAAALGEAQRLFAGFANAAVVLVDGLALGAMPEIIAPHAARLRLVALVHHPLAAEHGLSPEVAQALARSERQALAAAGHIVVTSAATRAALRELAVDPTRVSVVEPGTDPAAQADGSHGCAVQLLCVATLTPRKGHELLIRALASIPQVSWHLTCVGSLTRDVATVARLRALLGTLELDSHVTLTGETDARILEQHYARADLFVLPSLLEGYGMAVAEALARGVPVIGTNTGAIAALVGRHAGVVVPPNDPQALREALARVLTDRGLLAELATGARAMRDRLPRWDQAARRLEDALYKTE